MYDIFMISYDEPNADENYRRLVDHAGLVKRIHGVKGILNAHVKAAEQSRTPYFWVVDGDNYVFDSFDPRFRWGKEFIEYMEKVGIGPIGFWTSVNSVNGLRYGNGGIKLLPKQHTIRLKGKDRTLVDITHEVSEYRYYHDPVWSMTVINETPQQAFRAGFREAAKLFWNGTEESMKRLEIWCRVGTDRKNGEYCVEGAKTGRRFAQTHKPTDIINDWSFYENV